MRRYERKMLGRLIAVGVSTTLLITQGIWAYFCNATALIVLYAITILIFHLKLIGLTSKKKPAIIFIMYVILFAFQFYLGQKVSTPFFIYTCAVFPSILYTSLMY